MPALPIPNGLAPEATEYAKARKSKTRSSTHRNVARTSDPPSLKKLGTASGRRLTNPKIQKIFLAAP